MHASSDSVCVCVEGEGGREGRSKRLSFQGRRVIDQTLSMSPSRGRGEREGEDNKNKSRENNSESQGCFLSGSSRATALRHGCVCGGGGEVNCVCVWRVGEGG